MAKRKKTTDSKRIDDEIARIEAEYDASLKKPKSYRVPRQIKQFRSIKRANAVILQQYNYINLLNHQLRALVLRCRAAENQAACAAHQIGMIPFLK